MENSSFRTSSIIIIGNEILSGRTQELNSKYLAQRLLTIGVTVNEIRIIPDLKDQIIKCVNELRHKYTYIFTSGGIGPTHDDITAECIAAAFNVDLPINKEAKELLEEYYNNRKIKLNNARLRMARIPKGAKMIANPVSVAPGFQIKNVFVLAGVPNIFKAMVEGIIKNLEIDTPIESVEIIINKAEGDVAEKLGSIASIYPNVLVGSYPFKNKNVMGTKIVISHRNKKLLEEITALIKNL